MFSIETNWSIKEILRLEEKYVFVYIYLIDTCLTLSHPADKAADSFPKLVFILLTKISPRFQLILNVTLEVLSSVYVYVDDAQLSGSDNS